MGIILQCNGKNTLSRKCSPNDRGFLMISELENSEMAIKDLLKVTNLNFIPGLDLVQIFSKTIFFIFNKYKFCHCVSVMSFFNLSSSFRYANQERRFIY